MVTAHCYHFSYSRASLSAVQQFVFIVRVARASRPASVWYGPLNKTVSVPLGEFRSQPAHPRSCCNHRGAPSACCGSGIILDASRAFFFIHPLNNYTTEPHISVISILQMKKLELRLGGAGKWTKGLRVLPGSSSLWHRSQPAICQLVRWKTFAFT